MALTQNTTHATDAIARLPQKLQDKTNLAALIRACVSETQNVETVLWALLSERSIDDAEGEQLDVIGRIVNQNRGTTTDDDEYRVLLKARVLANKSSGSVKDILAVFKALLGSLSEVELEELFPASIILHIFSEDGITDEYAALYADFLGDSKAAGINAHLQYSANEASLTFAYPPSTLTTATFLYASQTSIKAASTENFPTSGTIIFNQGDDSAQMEVTYTSKTLTSFEGCLVQSGTAANKSIGSLVCGVTTIHNFLANDFDGEPFPAFIELFDSSLFPSAGAFVLHYGKSTRRVFSYTGNENNTLTGVVMTSEGTHASFGADSPIVFVDKGFSSTEQTNIGGYLSSILET